MDQRQSPGTLQYGDVEGVECSAKWYHSVGLRHFSIHAGGANATRKEALGEHFNLRGPPWWL